MKIFVMAFISTQNFEKIYFGFVISSPTQVIMSIIEAYDVKARKKVTMKDPRPYLMKNGTWALKGTSAETGISLFKIVGKKKPTIQSRFDRLKKMFASREC